MQSIWKTIEDFPDYEISQDGCVRRSNPDAYNRPMKILKASLSLGYPIVNLYRDGKMSSIHVHRLMAKTFLGPKPSPDHEVAHGDGDRSNIRLLNLRWATRKENQEDRYMHGRGNFGDTHASSKLNSDQVRQIKIALLEYRRGMCRSLATKYGVNSRTIEAIKNDLTWRHITISV